MTYTYLTTSFATSRWRRRLEVCEDATMVSAFVRLHELVLVQACIMLYASPGLS